MHKKIKLKVAKRVANKASGRAGASCSHAVPAAGSAPEALPAPPAAGAAASPAASPAAPTALPRPAGAEQKKKKAKKPKKASGGAGASGSGTGTLPAAGALAALPPRRWRWLSKLPDRPQEEAAVRDAIEKEMLRKRQEAARAAVAHAVDAAQRIIAEAGRERGIVNTSQWTVKVSYYERRFLLHPTHTVATIDG